MWYAVSNFASCKAADQFKSARTYNITHPQRPTVHLDNMTVNAVIMLPSKTQQHSPMQDNTLAEAAAMPPGTFGHAWGQFMGRRKFTADERPPVRTLLPVCPPAFLRLPGGSLGA